MTEKPLIFYLAFDTNKNKERHFKQVTIYLAERYKAIPIPFIDGPDIIRNLVTIGNSGARFGHIIFACHGTTKGLGHPGLRRGIDLTLNQGGQVSIEVFSKALASVLTGNPIVSLCACSCGSSPAWYRKQIFGGYSDPWGVGHRDGGLLGFAAKLRDQMIEDKMFPLIRAHSAWGEILSLPLLREFRPIKGIPGRSLFNIALPGILKNNVRKDWSNMRKFDRLVRGDLAREWILFGEDSFVEYEIRREFGYIDPENSDTND